MSKAIHLLCILIMAFTSMMVQGQTLQQCIDEMTAEVKREQYGTNKRCDMEAKYNASIISGTKLGGTAHERQYTVKQWKDIETARQKYCQRRNDALKSLANRVPETCMTKQPKSATRLGCYAERLDVDSFGLGNRDLDGF